MTIMVGRESTPSLVYHGNTSGVCVGFVVVLVGEGMCIGLSCCGMVDGVHRFEGSFEDGTKFFFPPKCRHSPNRSQYHNINLQEPCVLYIGRAYRYPPDVAFYIFFFNKYKY